MFPLFEWTSYDNFDQDSSEHCITSNVQTIITTDIELFFSHKFSSVPAKAKILAYKKKNTTKKRKKKKKTFRF